MVTAEFAVSLLGLTVVTGALIGTVALAGLQLRCTEAARAGARAAARGETPTQVESATHDVLPGAAVLVTSTGDRIRVRVTWRRSNQVALLAWLPGEVSAESVATTESP